MTLTRTSADAEKVLQNSYPPTVRSADLIILLDAGRVIEQGSHDELMALDGRYAHLFNLQARALLNLDFRSRIIVCLGAAGCCWD